MNSLFRCSWIKNTTIIKENAEIGEALLMESNISKTLKSVMKKCAEAGVGVPYRDSRLFFLKYLRDKHPDKIPQAFNEQYPEGGKRPEGKHVNALVGSMVLDEKLPKDFVEKMSDEFEDYSKEKVKSWDGKDIDRVTAFLRGENVQRGKPIKDPDEIETNVQIGGLSKEERFKKGSTGFETLNINLTPDTVLNYVDDSPLGNPIYTATKHGLKYRVTLKSKDLPAEIPLSSVTKNDVASVVVVEPKKLQTVAGPTIPPAPPTEGQRETPIADYPPYASGDYSQPDPEELVRGGKAAREELYGYEDEPDATTKAGSLSDDDLAFMDSPQTTEPETVEPSDQPEIEPQAVEEPAVEEPKLTRDQKFEKKKGYWEKLKETNPELYARAWAKRQETLRGEENEEDLDELNMTDKLNMSGEEDSEGINIPANHTIIIIKKSPQALHREMMQKIIQDKESRMRHERRNTLGY